MRPTKKGIYVLIILSGKHTNVEIHAGNSLETLIECRSSLEYRVSIRLCDSLKCSAQSLGMRMMTAWLH